MEEKELMSIESSGKSVDEAIFKGLQQMGISIDEVSIEIVRTETKGFLGIGAKPAVVRLTQKPEEKIDLDDLTSGRDEKRNENRLEKKPQREERRPKPQQKKKEDISREIKDRPEPAEKAPAKPATEKEKAEQLVKAAKDGARRPEKKDAPRPEKEFKREPKPAEAPAEAAEAEEPAEPLVYTLEAAEGNPAAEFVKGLIERMGAEGQVLAAMDGDTLRLRIDSEMMGMLIGHRGETLDAMQYLTGLVINKNRKTEGYTRVTLNTEEYREKREETLKKLAKKVAAQVKATGRPRVLEPMNPYERRVLHSTLQSNPDVTTHSEGEEPNRRVVVTPKRRARGGYSRSRGGRRSGAPRRENTAPAEENGEGTISREEYEKLYEAARAANPMFMGKPKEE